MDSRYPYTHHGPAVHGSKLLDYLISEYSRREDRPELFEQLDAEMERVRRDAG